MATIYRHRTDIDPHQHLASWFYVWCLWLGILIIAVGLLISITSIATRGVLLLSRNAILRWWDPPRYQCRLVRTTELERLYRYWQRFFPTDLSDLAQAEAWHRKNNQFCFFLFEVAPRRGKRYGEPKLVGSFSIIPLTKHATELVARDELSGAHLTADHITKPGARPAAVYLGGVIAEGMFARGAALARVSERLERFQEKGVPVYTRPVTDDGMRLVEKYDFEPVVSDHKGLKHIYRMTKAAD